jgi:hypothetical protein
MLCTERPSQRLFILTSCDCDGLKTHLGGKLNAKMAEPAYTQDSDDIARPRTAIVQRVESSNPGAHQRSCLYGWKLFGDQC